MTSVHSQEDDLVISVACKNYIPQGILPKGPYLPCVGIAVGLFWQDALDNAAAAKQI